ncbi:MAG: ATP-binding cassette domain-containing protein, partial [Paracoccaceae bacterium]
AAGFSQQVVAAQRDGSLAMLALQTGAALLAIVAVWLGHGWFSVPAESLVVILVLMVRLSAPLQALQGSALALRHGEVAWRDAQDLLSDLPRSESTIVPSWPRAPGFVLAGVTRSPDPAQPAVLVAISAEVAAGAITAISGPSGSGKTTLCDLLAGLDNTDAGDIRIDDQPFDAAARAAIGSVLAYVGQDPVPLQATLQESLTWGTVNVSEADIWSALDIVGAADLVCALPNGLSTELRLDGSHFSGGERQRFGLARALLRRPRLMILDEATNALDILAEEQVLRALFEARDGATVIMVSHRPSTAALADHVIQLDP